MEITMPKVDDSSGSLRYCIPYIVREKVGGKTCTVIRALDTVLYFSQEGIFHGRLEDFFKYYDIVREYRKGDILQVKV